MDYDSLSQEKKAELLEGTVAYRSAEEVRELYKTLGEVEFSARALAYACRFRGAEYVKALVECGATFDYEKSDRMYGTYKFNGADFSLSLLNFNNKAEHKHFIDRIYSIKNSVFRDHLTLDGGKVLPVLPLEERIEIAEYLCANGKTAGFDGAELLYYSILTGNFTMADTLKKSGVCISDARKKVLAEGGRGIMGSLDWYEYTNIMGKLSGENFVRFVKYFHAELDGKPLHFTDMIREENSSNFYKPETFRTFLTYFNQSKMNKSKLMKELIQKNNISCLEIAAESGWLKQPRKRDEMIEFAANNGFTEATAWLMDFKNRTADLAAEQEKAEKKMMRELNAAPDSVSELKKVWSYKKQEDGTLIITSYKGNKEEITVPAKIGKEPVTAIGAYAFSPAAPRRTQQQADNRARIRRIILPDSVKVIEECAFYWCSALEEINIPDGVTEICKSTFYDCCMKSLTIPDSVRAIAKSAFACCTYLERIDLPDGIPEIAGFTFSSCRALKEIEIPSSVEKIGEWAFHSCISLEKVIVHEGVTEIGKQAFSQCEALKELELPASVGKIKNYKCKGLHKGLPPITPFEKIPDITIIVTPKSYMEKYCKRNNIPYRLKEINAVKADSK